MAKKKKTAKKAKKTTGKKATKKAKPAKKAKAAKKAKPVKKAKATKKAKPAKKITTKKASVAGIGAATGAAIAPTSQNPFKPTPIVEEETMDFESMSETMDEDDTSVEEGFGEPAAERFEDDEIEGDEDMEGDDEEGYF